MQYRLSITTDTRARAVIEKVAAMAKWTPGAAGGTGRGRGIGFARYKNRAAYSAVVVELSVDETITLHHVWCATDAGLVINPDGVINQLEGGIIQGASWVLKEQVRFDNGVASFDWETYPVLKFSEVPEIDIELINTKDEVPLGAGEVTGGPTAAAIGNAVSHVVFAVRVEGDVAHQNEIIVTARFAERAIEHLDRALVVSLIDLFVGADHALWRFQQAFARGIVAGIGNQRADGSLRLLTRGPRLNRLGRRPHVVGQALLRPRLYIGVLRVHGGPESLRPPVDSEQR